MYWCFHMQPSYFVPLQNGLYLWFPCIHWLASSPCWLRLVQASSTASRRPVSLNEESHPSNTRDRSTSTPSLQRRVSTKSSISQVGGGYFPHYPTMNFCNFCRTLTPVPGTCGSSVPSVWFCVYPTDRTKTESSGTGMNVVHGSQTCRVRVWLYRTHRSPGNG